MTQTGQRAAHAEATPEGAAPVQTRREPPKALFKVVNPVMRTLLRSRLHRPLSNALVLLTFKGRKSGKVYSTPVAYHADGADLLVFTHSPWYRNLRGGAPVMLQLRGHRVPARATLVEDPDLVFGQVQRILAQIGLRNARRLGIMLERGHEPTIAELRAASQGTIMVRLHPGPR